MKKAISILLTCALVLSILATGAYAGDSAKVNYTIINPYETVDWENSDTYKACLHCHTSASDGDVDLLPWLELYYGLDYDILAVTDHGVINNGWNKDKKLNGIFCGFRSYEPLTEEQYNAIQTGTYPSETRTKKDRGMIDITGGIECNMAVVSKTHVNGYWSNYGQGVWGTENDYETAPKKIEELGGYSVLNHVGDWVNSNNFPARSHSAFYINYFANIFTKYKTCLGMEIINNTDNCTRADRELWDELLSVVIPTGRNIWGFADDDSEAISDVGRSFELFPLTENTEENVKNAMINGAFFAASKFQRNALRENEITEGDGKVANVTNILCSDNEITVEFKDTCECEGNDEWTVEWISDGEIIKTSAVSTGTDTLSLNDYDGSLGCYVRFVIKNEKHGVVYSQAFELQYEGRENREIPASPIPDNIFGKIFWFWYQRLGTSLISLIVEKIMDWCGLLPVYGRMF